MRPYRVGDVIRLGGMSAEDRLILSHAFDYFAHIITDDTQMGILPRRKVLTHRLPVDGDEVLEIRLVIESDLLKKEARDHEIERARYQMIDTAQTERLLEGT